MNAPDHRIGWASRLGGAMGSKNTMRKTMINAFLVLAALLAAAGCAGLARQPEAADPDVQEWVRKLGSDNPYMFADGRNRLVRLGCPAIPHLKEVALMPVGDDDETSRWPRNAINVLGEIAKRHDCAEEVRATLVEIAIRADNIVALTALNHLKGHDRDAVLLDLVERATRPEQDEHAKRARVIIFSMDKKGGIDLMLDLMTGERVVEGFRGSVEMAGSATRRGGLWPFATRPPEDEPPHPHEPYMIMALRRWTYHHMGYDPVDPPRERAEAIGRWRAWWSKNRGTYDKLFQLEDYLPLIREMEEYRLEAERE